MSAQETTRPAALQALSVLRSAVGAGTWIAPGRSWKLFGLGPIPDRGSTAVISRLFGVRDLALGLALQSDDPNLRRAAVRTGLVIDSVDAAASLLGVGRGAPRASLVGVTLGALLFVGLGVIGLREESARGGLPTTDAGRAAASSVSLD